MFDCCLAGWLTVLDGSMAQLLPCSMAKEPLVLSPLSLALLTKDKGQMTSD